MTTYIVTVKKALNKVKTLKIEAESKKAIVDALSILFGAGIAPINAKYNIVQFDTIPNYEKGFYYQEVDINSNESIRLI
jgi:hypothetical protein